MAVVVGDRRVRPTTPAVRDSGPSRRALLLKVGPLLLSVFSVCNGALGLSKFCHPFETLCGCLSCTASAGRIFVVGIASGPFCALRAIAAVAKVKVKCGIWSGGGSLRALEFVFFGGVCGSCSFVVSEVVRLRDFDCWRVLCCIVVSE